MAVWDSSARLCFLWPCLSQGGSSPGEQVMLGMGWAVSFLVALLALQVPATAHFGVLCSPNSATRMPIPSRAFLESGSNQAKWSSLSLRDQSSCILPGAEREHKMCVPLLAVPCRKALSSSTKPLRTRTEQNGALEHSAGDVPEPWQSPWCSHSCDSPVLTDWAWGWLPAPRPPSLPCSALLSAFGCL